MTDFKVTDEAVLVAARALCAINSEVCGVDEQDNWKLYSDDFKKDAIAAIEAALPVMFEIAAYRHKGPFTGDWQYSDKHNPHSASEQALFTIKEPK